MPAVSLACRDAPRAELTTLARIAAGSSIRFPRRSSTIEAAVSRPVGCNSRTVEILIGAALPTMRPEMPVSVRRAEVPRSSYGAKEEIRGPTGLA